MVFKKKKNVFLQKLKKFISTYFKYLSRKLNSFQIEIFQKSYKMNLNHLLNKIKRENKTYSDKAKFTGRTNEITQD